MTVESLQEFLPAFSCDLLKHEMIIAQPATSSFEIHQGKPSILVEMENLLRFR